MNLRVYEIFHSIQGESSRIGLPTVFVRLTGCPLRCGYCDTEYAFEGGGIMSSEAILEKIASHHTPYVCVTGGEPLAQKECYAFLTQLCDAGYSVSLETSGAMDIAPVDPRVSIIMDIKTPGSGEASKNRWENIPTLQAKDEVKFVICDQDDYQWAKTVLEAHGIHTRCPVLFSPVFGQVHPQELAEWVLHDQLPVRMQVQLHKVIWGEKPGV